MIFALTKVVKGGEVFEVDGVMPLPPLFYKCIKATLDTAFIDFISSALYPQG